MSNGGNQGSAPSRIALNALSQAVGGGITVARDLTLAMARERPATRFGLFCASAQLSAVRYPENVEVFSRPDLAGFARRTRWEQLTLPRILRDEGYDALLNLGGFAVFRSPIPQVSVWQNPNIFTRVKVPRRFLVDAYIRVQRAVQGASMRRAEMNVFLTRDSLREAATRWDMSRISHVVIPNGVSVMPRPHDGEELAEQPFVLAVGHSYFHKNYEALIDATARYQAKFGDPPRVLIAGGAVDSAYHVSLEKRIRDRGLAGLVRFLGPQRPEQVAALYARARVYVMTSLLESFGLTPLEAMMHGVPAVVAEASCIPEVCGDAALYCDPRDPDDIAEKVHRVLIDEPLRKELCTRGYSRVEQFSWAESARSHLTALDSCATRRDGWIG